MLFKDYGRRSVVVVEERELCGYDACGAGQQPLLPSTLPTRQQQTREAGGGGRGAGGTGTMADCDSDSNSVSSSQGSSQRMTGSHMGWSSSDHEGRRSRGDGGAGRSNSSGTLKAVESTVMRVIGRVREYGFEEDVCSELREHFAYLPARYALNIDPERHEDVLLHMRLLQEAREVEEEGSRGSSILDEPFAVPFVNVRKVQLWSSVDMAVTSNSSLPQKLGMGSSGCWGLKIPKPAFGSCTNLASLGCCASPKVHPTAGGGSLTTTRSSVLGGHATSPPLQSTSPGNVDRAVSRPAFGNFTNPLHMDDDSAGYNSDNEDAAVPTYGYEITLATSDRHGLLRHYTTAISNIKTELNIKEAHVFSTSDGMALEVFVVEGWDGDDAEGLRQAVLLAVDAREEGHSKYRDAELKAAVESIQYEDWAVDFNQLVIGEPLGKGSSGQLYRGKYMSQDVAIKMIALVDGHNVDMDSDSLQACPASERLQTFKQEFSIMRLVRHKNVVQFIGACSCWPRLCIVTELMSGGSVRDVLEFRMGGLDIPLAVKVFRDAAKGMDFLHKRGIVHRDLKAANLLIDEHDVVKVCDFGVARLKPTPVSSSGKGAWTAAEMTAETGTYRWMSPEVLEHKPYDHKADVYSFGITMWEVLTGEIPYAGFTPLQAAIGVVQRGLRPEIPPFVPEKLSLLAQQCWHQDPKQRPEFSEVVAVLEEMVTVRTPNRRFMFGGRKTRATLLLA